MKSNNIKINLYHIVLNIKKHPILEEYLKLYLNTDEGKKELNLKDGNGQTPLMYASRYSNKCSSIETVKLLIENGTNVNLQDRYGQTALMHACKFTNTSSSIDIVKLLIDKGANVNLQDNQGRTALMFASGLAIMYSSIETVKVLIENGANVNLQNKFDGSTALMMALGTFNPIEIVKLFIENQTDINLQDRYGNTVLIYACKSLHAINSIEILKLILEKI